MRLWGLLISVPRIGAKCIYYFTEDQGDADDKDEGKISPRYINDRILQEMDDGVNVNTLHYGIKANQFFLVQHSQSPTIPDCPTGTSTLWSGYSLYSFSFDNNTITRDLGTIDSCVQQVNQAYFSYCSGVNDCNMISTILWLSNRNASIGRCSVCLVSSSPITLHSQLTIPPSCPSNWSPLWVGYSHLQNAVGRPNEGLSSTGSCLKHFLNTPVVRCPVKGPCKIDSEKLWLLVANSSRTVTANQISRCVVCLMNITRS